MKKLFAILFIYIYVIPLIGVIKSSHYCMGSILDVKYFSLKANSCFCESGEGISSKCCSDELEVFQVDGDDFSSWLNVWSKDVLSQKSVLAEIEYTFLINDHDEDLFISADLPPPRFVPFYILTSDLQYYG